MTSYHFDLLFSLFIYFFSKHYLAGNMQLIKIWGDDHGPWMQALHCVFGVGALLGPLVATPFLSPTDQVMVMVLLGFLII